MKRVFILQPSPHPARRNAAEFILNAAPDGFAVTVAEPTRTLEQNARMWALLTDISEQVEWYGKRLTPEDWKHVFTASLRKLTVVPNLDGTGFVALGLSTSRMSKRELGDLMTLIEAFGAERGVEWSEPVMEAA
jgi:sulfite reductase beta subunit-like hemoprotein